MFESNLSSLGQTIVLYKQEYRRFSGPKRLSFCELFDKFFGIYFRLLLFGLCMRTFV